MIGPEMFQVLSYFYYFYEGWNQIVKNRKKIL